MKKYIRCILLFLLLIGLVSSESVAFAQAGSEEGLYVPETGHWIRGSFLEMYQSADDPLLLFGYPLTDALTDPINGQQTQYFEKARFDEIEQNGVRSIRIAPLGELLYTPGNELAPLSISRQACRFFDDTGLPVCYAFLAFYQAHQGETYFGAPISQVEIEAGRYVQYFEKSRMEWRPELNSTERVALTDLGRYYYQTRLGDLEQVLPTAQSDLPTELVQIQAHAFVANALSPANSHQELYITVQDQNYQPIEGAMLTVIIRQPDQAEEVYRPAITDENGISTLKFEVGDLAVNEVVQAEIQVAYKGFQTQTSTWFRIWW